ncbi:MAG: class I SAM-dependent methyltransferase family protein [Halobacteriota archaeon]|nr:class I SAM-dependent methyltransferase family protein [Halobacteriota archaeon]
MQSICIKVPRRSGESARRASIDADLLNIDLRVISDGEFIYLPLKRRPEKDEMEQIGQAASLSEISERKFEEVEGRRTLQQILGFKPSFEMIGDIAILNPDVCPDFRSSAEAILSAHKNIKVVVRPITPVQGTFRVKNFEIISGEDRTETVHREYGCSYALDLQKVYFSPRLSTERSRVADQVKVGESVVDMFAGVGSFTIQVAKKAGKVIAIDINPEAINLLRKNLELNHIINVDVMQGDVRDFSQDLKGLADRIIMNLPHTAHEFLPDAVLMLKDTGILHYYDIRHEDDLFDDALKAIKDAAGSFRVSIYNKRKIRSYAPHKYNIAIDVKIDK